MTRLFVALKIPGEVRRKIIEFRNEIYPDYKKYRWESEEKIHLTLKFIGDVNTEYVDEIADSLDFINEYETFNCELGKFGFFYRKGRASILWLGMSIDRTINGLAKRLNTHFERYSVSPERREFKPHLTLMRLKGYEENLLIKSFEKAEIPSVKFKSDEIALFKSTLMPRGSVYEEIKNFKLK